MLELFMTQKFPNLMPPSRKNIIPMVNTITYTQLLPSRDLQCSFEKHPYIQNLHHIE